MLPTQAELGNANSDRPKGGRLSLGSQHLEKSRNRLYPSPAECGWLGPVVS